MALVWVLLAIVVLGGVAVVAAGRGQGLTPSEPDRPDLSLPPGRPLVRTDVDQVRFSVGLRGYRMDEVDDVLDRLAYDLEARDARISVLEQEVATRWAAGPKPAEPDVAEPEVAEAEPVVEPDVAEPEVAEDEATEDEAIEDEAAAEEDQEDDEETLVGRTMIVPFQQTDSRFVRPPGEPSTDDSDNSDDPDERGD